MEKNLIENTPLISTEIASDIKAPDQTSLAQSWREENKEAIDEYNRLVAKNGCFGDSFRKF
jgi:post-segregation antitoxin (ccd killing protein)